MVLVKSNIKHYNDPRYIVYSSSLRLAPLWIYVYKTICVKVLPKFIQYAALLKQISAYDNKW